MPVRGHEEPASVLRPRGDQQLDLFARRETEPVDVIDRSADLDLPVRPQTRVPAAEHSLAVVEAAGLQLQ